MARVNTEEMQGPKAPEILMPASGEFDHDDITDLEVVVDIEADKKDWTDKMRFMHEPVCIRINDTTNPNEEPRVPVCVGGARSHPIWGNHLPRGVEIVVKRYVVEALLRAKPITVKTIPARDADGADTARIVRSIGTLYPFEIVNAKPKDTDWLRKIRAEV